ncbi:putative inner membrane protein [Pillotina sp. SPG140]|jgi:inner membrane protein
MAALNEPTTEAIKHREQRTFLKKISSGYTFKVIILAFLILLLLIPLTMIGGLVRDRGRTAREAESTIMEAWGKQLVEAGPVLLIPGIRTVEMRSRTERDGEKVEIREIPVKWVVTPEYLAIEADFSTEIRRRGIFSVPLFSGTLKLSGTFDPSQVYASVQSHETMYLDKATLIIALSSQKGIRKITAADWNGNELFFQPGVGSLDIPLTPLSAGIDTLFSTGAGIHASVPALEQKTVPFTVAISIQGGQSVQMLPIAKDTLVTVRSDWASPSFHGAFLPSYSTVSDTAFEALWEISYLSRDIPLFWIEEGEGKRDYSGALFGVNFLRTLNTYSLNTRAVKYAILFLMIPFLTLFLLEIFTKQTIHPVPYILSGIADVIFYLLLLSLSEQMPFYTAYLIAAIAVTVLMTLYARSLLPSWNTCWYMALVLVISYILLYAVLNAESYALLIGSVGAFVVTALIMFITRNLDWYGHEQSDH